MATATTATSQPPPQFHHDEAQTQHSPPEEPSSHNLPTTSSVTDYETVLQNAQPDLSSLLQTTILRSSPYTEPEHLLDLARVDAQSGLLALALCALAPARPDYATAEYRHALQWDRVIALLAALAKEQGRAWTKQSFYIVEFRSRLKELDQAENDLLYLLDRKSHVEANASGGLLKYWYGDGDATRRNIATCVWRSKEEAINGGRGPWHKQARGVVGQMYEMIQTKGLCLTIEDGIASWDISTHP